MSSPVIFFTGLLLPPSETFIRTQGASLQQFTPYYVGSRAVKGLSLPEDRSFVVNSSGTIGSVKEAVFKLTGFAPELEQKIQRLNPALIHAHFGVNGTLAMPIAKRLGLPFITTFYGLDSTLEKSTFQRTSLTQRVYLHRQSALKQECKLFVAVSDFIKKKLLEQGFPEDKVVSNYIGVDLQSLQPKPQIPREPLVLFIGRLVEKKGCAYLIQAMAQVQEAGPDVKLIIIGDGPLRESLEGLAAGLLRNYQFLGTQPPEVCKDWMYRAKLLVVPSVTASNGDSEGLPTVLIESQAMGLPVVASIHAGIPEAIVDGETGLLAVERDWQKLGYQISTLLNNSELWQRFSINGQERAKQQFDLSHQTRNLEKLYQRIITDSGRFS
ncbi:glycosyltransferase [Leptolyngbya sp. AN02str]|uniref:glycosyltransferase n=1 Tax=Leptolyngbya sp. AN02str TaxID=3423363 RepID=UPI003D312A86